MKGSSRKSYGYKPSEFLAIANHPNCNTVKDLQRALTRFCQKNYGLGENEEISLAHVSGRLAQLRKKSRELAAKNRGTIVLKEFAHSSVYSDPARSNQEAERTAATLEGIFDAANG